MDDASRQKSQENEMRDELNQLDEDIETLRKAKATVSDPLHLRGEGPAYYQSGTDEPQEDDQQITPPG
jgi:hypothetical protein